MPGQRTWSECDCFLDYMFQRRPLSGQGHSQFELATLAKTDGNRTASARLPGFSIKTCCVIRLRNIQRTALMCHHPVA